MTKVDNKWNSLACTMCGSMTSFEVKVTSHNTRSKMYQNFRFEICTVSMRSNYGRVQNLD